MHRRGADAQREEGERERERGGGGRGREREGNQACHRHMTNAWRSRQLHPGDQIRVQGDEGGGSKQKMQRGRAWLVYFAPSNKSTQKKKMRIRRSISAVTLPSGETGIESGTIIQVNKCKYERRKGKWDFKSLFSMERHWANQGVATGGWGKNNQLEGSKTVHWRGICLGPLGFQQT